MSGGAFDYISSKIYDFAENLQMKIDTNDIKNDWDNAYEYDDTTLQILQNLANNAKLVANLSYEAEWLYSGDISEETFISRCANVMEEHITNMES